VLPLLTETTTTTAAAKQKQRERSLSLDEGNTAKPKGQSGTASNAGSDREDGPVARPTYGNNGNSNRHGQEKAKEAAPSPVPANGSSVLGGVLRKVGMA
jgi:hypothetical protein